MTQKVGRKLESGDWHVMDIELRKECPWCGSGDGIETIEFAPVRPAEVGFVIQCQYYWREGLPFAYFSHKSCGPDWCYWVDINRVRGDAAGWHRHMRTKFWADSIIFEAIDLAQSIGKSVKRDRSVKPDVKPVKTYFIQSEFGGHIKIGKSSNPPGRLKSLQTGRVDRLKILKVITGDFESELHGRFAHLRDNGEWFRPEKELIAYLELQCD